MQGSSIAGSVALGDPGVADYMAPGVLFLVLTGWCVGLGPSMKQFNIVKMVILSIDLRPSLSKSQLASQQWYELLYFQNLVEYS